MSAYVGVTTDALVNVGQQGEYIDLEAPVTQLRLSSFCNYILSGCP